MDGADYVVRRDHNGTAFQLPNEVAGTTPGQVTAEDYTAWRANFGMTAGPEAAFRVGSVVFDTTAGAGLGSGGAVPEPNTGWLLLLALGAALVTQSRKLREIRPQLAAAIVTQRNSGQRGGNAMSMRFGSAFAAVVGLCDTTVCVTPAHATTGGIPLTNFDFELPGPTGTKVIAFDAMGVPIPGIIFGWTFPGPGVEDFGHPGVLGDSGTEGSGNLALYGNDMILSTLDGVAYQTAAGSSIVNPPVNQTYKFGFDAHDIFTTNASIQQLANAAELTARF